VKHWPQNEFGLEEIFLH